VSDETRFLIVNADDFGQSAGINAGIIKAHEHGVLTSASMMVRWPAAGEAATYARANPSLSIGLHADFGEWAFENDEWVPVYEVVPHEDEAVIEAELRRQLESFRSLVGRDPTHLDSHQHVHRSEPLFEAFRRVSLEIRAPLRHASRVRHCGDLHGQERTGVRLEDVVTVENMIAIIRRLEPGFTELGCHPGEGSDIESTYREEREAEVAVLCDARVREALASEGIVLSSFADARERVGW
jgi:predicted glycoside hydrolase/deacetylase ChbG (UPF0249 family)